MTDYPETPDLCHGKSQVLHGSLYCCCTRWEGFRVQSRAPALAPGYDLDTEALRSDPQLMACLVGLLRPSFDGRQQVPGYFCRTGHWQSAHA
ncbi:predicted protein [Histoplasma capsulatum var. duboisii H88]|uniref:Predicted protein n=2 Tax=Ajellomyces capsulatus TaxID=5037 RepID=F0UCF3_AJEC8|nr:predicted protein [Histoplasma capsulatum H143]EGC43229.1 predicted protein [Histoplasma capsulatum var. duboisii H88]